MVKSLYTGVSGLKTHQQRMDVIGNNIANVNTVGYKTDVVTFADVYYQTKRTPSGATANQGGVNPRMVGYGVKMNTVTANMTQSGYTYSDSKYDLALDGEGFFQVMDAAGNIFYTRAGVFDLDDQGNLVNADGYYVLGVSGTSEGTPASSQPIRFVIPDTDPKASSATKMVNGTNVTLSVSAPSDYTNMSVSFKEAEFPYATYANNILTIFFNKDEQFNSEDEFDRAIQQALQAGGITLPDEVELHLEFEEIPNNISAVAAANTVEDIKFTTDTATARFHYAAKGANGTMQHAYIDFTVEDPSCKDTIKIVYAEGNKSGKVVVGYDEQKREWSIELFEDTTATDISDALKRFLAEDGHAAYPELKCTGFLIPTGIEKKDALAAFAAETMEVPAPTEEDPAATKTVDIVHQLAGVKSGDSVTGGYDFAVKEPGAYANNYRITFQKVSGYGNTKAVWDGNNVTISICADTTIADVNAAIKSAAKGNDKKIITFYDINGLAYGDPAETVTLDADGNTVTTTEYALGYTKVSTTATAANGDPIADVYYDRYGNDITEQVENGDIVVPPEEKTGENNVWNIEIRDAFFGGNPSVNPKGGDDSFFTKTAKAMDTFQLLDGRTGAPQPLKSLEDVIIQRDGTIIGYHAVHGYMNLGRIDIAMFDNPNGLEKCGGTNFRETVASGPARLATAGSDGAGQVLQGALEMSNVDLADEFTNMITTQRGYQANSRVVTVSDTMLEELLNLKR